MPTEGNQLFEELTDLTGLPKELISDELVSILETSGSCPKSMTLDDLRAAMMSYLIETLGPLAEAELVELTDAAPDAASATVIEQQGAAAPVDRSFIIDVVDCSTAEPSDSE